MTFHYDVATEGVRAGFRSFSVLGLIYKSLSNAIIYIKQVIYKTLPNTNIIEKVMRFGNSSASQEVKTQIQSLSNTSKIEKVLSEVSTVKVAESISIVKPGQNNKTLSGTKNSVSITKRSNKIKI